MTAKEKFMTESKRPPLIDDDGEVREITMEDVADFRNVRIGRPPLPSELRKQRVTLMVDPEVLERLKADGKGWQTRANALLRKAVGL